jgi:heme-degrading monooxygenase HmoA
MFVVHNRIDVPADKASAFEASFARSMRETLPEVPGLRRSVLLRPAKEGEPYVATMEFASRDDFTAWRNSDAFRAAHGGDRSAGPQTPSMVESFTVVEEMRP